MDGDGLAPRHESSPESAAPEGVPGGAGGRQPSAPAYETGISGVPDGVGAPGSAPFPVEPGPGDAYPGHAYPGHAYPGEATPAVTWPSDAGAQATGDERVDAMLSRLGDLPGQAVGRHVGVYDDLHHGLQEVLASTGQDQPDAAAAGHQGAGDQGAGHLGSGQQRSGHQGGRSTPRPAGTAPVPGPPGPRPGPRPPGYAPPPPGSR